jgi:hypothetical protein
MSMTRPLPTARDVAAFTDVSPADQLKPAAMVLVHARRREHDSVRSARSSRSLAALSPPGR